MEMTRRKFVSGAALGLASTSFSKVAAADSSAAIQKGEKPLLVSTWPFGKASNDAGLKVLQQGGSILDAVEQGIWVTESDVHNQSVGLSGLPNAAGVVQLDSSIMHGPGHKAGSVAALEGIRHPISAARRVMEKTPHEMLVGEGARMFALEQGLESIEVDSHDKYEAWKKKRASEKQAQIKDKNHDTIALLVLGADGNIAGGCSTSGLAGKLPGRVGDSPIIGCGLYVDNEVGAAGATGIGENVMRYCGSFLVVEFMRQGMHPQEACLATIRRIAKQDPRGANLSISFVALDKYGRYGAASSAQGFNYSVTTLGSSTVLSAPGIGKLDVGEVGGNQPK